MKSSNYITDLNDIMVLSPLLPHPPTPVPTAAAATATDATAF